MPILITDTDALQKIASVEWGDNEESRTNFCAHHAGGTRYSFATILRIWTEMSQKGELSDDFTFVDAIYGVGGANRYHVYANGHIALSRGHCTNPIHIERATQQGFEIL